MTDEENGARGVDSFDHNDLKALGDALKDAGRGLVGFGADYPYLDPAEREVRRHRVGRILALMNAVWPQMDAAIKADDRPAITSHERDARLYHVDRLFRLLENVTKKGDKP